MNECPWCDKRPIHPKPFSVKDHCFEPHKHSPQDEEYIDRCSYQNCGLPEFAHEWTVEAYMSNWQALMVEKIL